jgi:cobalt-zinc-cadmium efflux system outer membrane protein
VRLISLIVTSASLIRGASAETLTWQQVRDRFAAVNPTLSAGAIGIQESRAAEVTAHLRPNPSQTVSLDQLNPFTGNPYRPLGEALPFVSTDYLIERQGKRELRYESAQQGTAITRSQQADLERNLLFNLRNAFVQAIQAKAVLALARESLAYYDRVLSVSEDRFKAGDIARVDLDRLQLQRIQFLTDVQNAEVNVRTAKIQILMLLNDRTPVEQFDVTGQFDFSDPLMTLSELRDAAQAARPDLRAAIQTIDKAKTDYRLAVANGSTDPTVGVDFGRNPPIPVYFGVSVTIPLRIFDRNQGEKTRTQLDIGRNERLRARSEERRVGKEC